MSYYILHALIKNRDAVSVRSRFYANTWSFWDGKPYATRKAAQRAIRGLRRHFGRSYRFTIGVFPAPDADGMIRITRHERGRPGFVSVSL